MRTSIGAGAILVAFGGLQAQAQAQGGAATSPATRPGAGNPPPAAAPDIIRPSATLGPAAPGAPSPGRAAPPSGGNQAAAAPAASSPRVSGGARYRSVSKAQAVMFDAPSDKAKKLFVAPEGMPVEVISVLRTWVKVRDPLGDLAWISRDDLTERRMVMATSVAPLRREPQPSAPSWFNVDRGVVLELLEEQPVNGFIKVKYAEGQIGYLQPNQVWGL